MGFKLKMTVWRMDSVNQFHVLSGPGRRSNQREWWWGFLVLDYQCTESRLWKLIFTPRNYFLARREGVRWRKPANTGVFDLNNHRLVWCKYGTNFIFCFFNTSAIRNIWVDVLGTGPNLFMPKGEGTDPHREAAANRR